jgi:hypothetical protein
MHTVVETPSFLAAAKAAGMSDDVRAEIVEALADNPQMGDLIAGAGGVRKFRFAKPGMGKRGGYRVVSFYHDEGLPVFLLSVFGKNEKDNLSKAERNDLGVAVKAIAEAYVKKEGKGK